MTEDPVVSSAMASILSPGTPACLTAACMASVSARMWSSWDCVAYSGSSRLRWRGYSAIADPIMPRSLSTMETRTLRVPKSTPATIAIRIPLWLLLISAYATGRGLASRPWSLVPVSVPTEVASCGFMHSTGNGRKIGGHMVLETVFANVMEQFLHLWNLDYACAAEGVQGIIREPALANVASHLSSCVIGREASKAHFLWLYQTDNRSVSVVFAHSTGDDLLEVHVE